MKKTIAILVCSIFFISGCATMFSSSMPGTPRTHNVFYSSSIIQRSGLSDYFDKNWLTGQSTANPDKYNYLLDDENVIWWGVANPDYKFSWDAIRIEWITPSGVLYQEDIRSLFSSKELTSVLRINGRIGEDLEGEWTVKVVKSGLNEDLIEEKKFIIGKIKRDVPEEQALDANVIKKLNLEQSDVLTILDDKHIIVEEDGSYKMNIHKKMKILNERGKRFAEIYVPYRYQKELIKINKAYTITPDGKVYSATEKRNLSFYPGYPDYRGSVLLAMSMPSVDVGSIVEYDIDLYSPVPTIKGDYFIDELILFLEPTLSAELTLDVPTNKDVKVRLNNSDKTPEVTHLPSGTMVRYKWLFEYQKAVKIEEYMPSLRKICPELVLTSFTMWGAVAEYGRGLLKNDEPVEEIRTLVSDVTLDCETDLDKAKRIFNYVQKNVRYVAIKIGEGPDEAQSIKDILKNKYGDCKDHSILLVAMLREAGLKANPVLVRPRIYGEAHQDFPSPYEFTHAIVLLEIDQNLYWLDATAKGSPFDEAPFYLQDIDVFVIKEDCYGFERTPAVAITDNFIETKHIITIEDDLSITGEFALTAGGANGLIYKDIVSILKTEDKEKYIKSLISYTYGSIDTASSDFPENIDPNTNFTIDIKFTGLNKASKVENYIIFAPFSQYENSFFVRHDAKRENPIETPFKYVSKINISLKIPAGYKIKTLPENRNATSILEDFSISYLPQGNEIMIEVIKNKKANILPAEVFEEIQDYYKTISGYLKENIVFEPTGDSDI